MPDDDRSGGRLVEWTTGEACVNERWEAAYRRFETRAQEKAKFMNRLKRLGVDAWPRTGRVVELFCGSGAGLECLEELGFTNLAGVDLSPTLLGRYTGVAERIVGDATDLRFSDDSLDGVIVQGGLHHLARLPDDLEAVLDGIRRTLRPDGKLAVVEPWNTPFLQFVHFCCRIGILRKAWPKLDALAVMIQEEIDTYRQWLSRGDEIGRLLRERFRVERWHVRWGKLEFTGAKEEPLNSPP